MSLSKNQLKFITSLRQKKYRIKYELFVAEGVKVVSELLNSSIELHSLYQIENCFQGVPLEKQVDISEKDLKRISALKSPNKVLALFQIPVAKEIDSQDLILALDTVNDPGNLGTIIRLCDWFGISSLLCSKDTVDCFNQKVVQASMGSLTRVNVHYVDLETAFETLNLPVYAAAMNGMNVYQEQLPKKGILLMGNEANGIHPDLLKKAQHKIAIPRFGDLQKTESLNVATATAILLSEFRRNT